MLSPQGWSNAAGAASDAGFGARPPIAKSSALSSCALEAGESIKSCFERLTKEGQITGGIRGVDFLVAVWAKGNGRDEM
jgi:hypothetical protein